MTIQREVAKSDEFDLINVEAQQVMCLHRICSRGQVVANLYEAEMFRMQHVCDRRPS